MPSKKRRRLDQIERQKQIHAREQARLQDPAYTLEDIAWKYAPGNGNPTPTAACGQRHRGPCCGCGDGYCCHGI